MKTALRKKILDIRNNMSQDLVQELSKKAVSSLISTKEYKEAKTIFTYVSFNNEVDTTSIIKDKKKSIIVPFMERNSVKLTHLKDYNMREGRYGILEPIVKTPVDLMEIDLVIIPGIVFDTCGNRIGFGGGFYDRILKKIDAPRIALCYDYQVLENVPCEHHDVMMDMIVTEKRIINIPKQ
jgi:5-formyltetrahydrofolate cyclo-ligase